MKIDQDYLKKILEACQASEEPTFDIRDLEAAGFDYNDTRFEFHMKILTDHGLVERDDGEPGFGLQKGIDGFLSWSALPLRLTASGHQFVKGLSNPDVWETLNRDFQDASIETLEAESLRLLKGRSYNVVHNTTNIGTAINSPVQQAGGDCLIFCVLSHTLLPDRARSRYGQERYTGFLQRSARSITSGS
jgi:hypothetical protein